MSQVWEAFVCSLYEIDGYNLTYQFHTIFNARPESYPRYLPVPVNTSNIEENPLHGHIGKGYLILKEFNATIIMETLVGTHSHCFTDLVRTFRLGRGYTHL